ncbi:CHAT domain-containing protein [Suillus cothurnatus]|nr:CHAT domain-containing protein [Suillus cothurnatus]
MPGSLEERYIRLEVMSGKNLQVPSGRIPAGIYVSITVDSRGCWKSAISVLSSDQSVVWGNTVTLPSHTSPALSVEIRASYEADRTLGNGEVVGKLQTSWDELLDHGDEPFDLSFPPVRDVCPSLTLRAATVHACDEQNNTLSDSLVDSDITRDTDAGHALLAEYISSEAVSHLNDAMQHFQSVLDQCPVDHPDHAAALTNLANESNAVYIHESAQLCCKLLPLCSEGTYLCSIVVNDAVGYVINNLPIDASDEGIHLRRNILELCPVGYQLRPRALDRLAEALRTRFQQCGNIDDIDETIQLRREVVFLCPEGHSDRGGFLNNLALSLVIRFDNQGKPNDLDEAITLYEESLHLFPVGHGSRDSALDNLGGALVTRFKKRGDIDDITRAISLRREALTLCPPGHPRRDTVLNNLALALQIRYDKSYVSEDLNEAIDRYRESHLLNRLDNPRRHITLYNLSAALCSRFTHTRKNGDVQEAIQLCQEALASLPSLHPDRSVVYAWLQRAYRLVTAYNPTPPICHPQWSTSDCRRYTLLKVSLSVSGWLLTGLAKQKYINMNLPSKHTKYAASWGHTSDNSTRQLTFGAGPWPAVVAGVSTHESLEERDRFARAIRHASVMGPKVPRNDLIVLLRTVWNEIMLPIVNVLENVLKLNHRSRIWLCPTAAFTFIPLHAAHPFQTKADGSKESCLEDLYVCSYTPTLSALVRSRQMMKKRVTPSFATIGQGQPGAGKGKALLAVDSELELVHKLVPATAKHVTISGDTATRAGALQALEENTWVHLACHGKQDPTQPYDSHFVMRDEHLTLLDIMEKDIPHAEFAFLSACHTAVGDEKTPDEVIHLAAGLQFSGFKSVIGTLWEVNDAVAKHVVEAFYKYMFMDLKDGKGVVMDCSRAAWALNCATHAVKTKVPLEQRMVFIHIGV